MSYILLTKEIEYELYSADQRGMSMSYILLTKGMGYK